MVHGVPSAVAELVRGAPSPLPATRRPRRGAGLGGSHGPSLGARSFRRAAAEGHRASLPEGDVRAARAKRSARPSQKEIIADLETRLAEALGRLAKAEGRLAKDEAEFVALRDPLPPEVEERAADLATATEDGAREELAALARQFHWRPRDFEQLCSAVHISRRARRQGRTRQPVDGSEASSDAAHPAERWMGEAADA